MKQPAVLGPDQILQETARFFGEPVLKLTAPGGRSRTSFRAYLTDRTVIVSQRAETEQSLTEQHVLAALNRHTDSVPRLLGTSGGLMFQSDVGLNRLNGLIHSVPGDQRPGLASKAVQAVFDIHRAALRVGLGDGLPVAGARSYPDDDLLGVPDRAAIQLAMRPLGFDAAALCPWFVAAPRRFVKWDCRAGNAALDATATLRWFDFEDARLAQGPEDFAWLIADETWPVAADVMLDLVQDRLTADDTDQPQAFMTYLEEFATLHALRRLRLIVAEARRSGWLDKVSILTFDRVGVNPHWAEMLSLRGMDLARRNRSTLPLVAVFDRLAEVFRKVRAPVIKTAAP